MAGAKPGHRREQLGDDHADDWRAPNRDPHARPRDTATDGRKTARASGSPQRVAPNAGRDLHVGLGRRSGWPTWVLITQRPERR